MLKVKIKNWNKLVEEFGYDEENNCIPCSGMFPDELEKNLPKNRIITIEEDLTGIYIWNSQDSGIWFITEDMIEEIFESEE